MTAEVKPQGVIPLMKTIELTQGKVTIVDDDDYEWLSQWKWYFNNMGYAVRFTSRKLGKRIVWMHKEILKTPVGMESDHINGNKLDNQKENLRTCNHSQNNANKGKQSNNTSGYKGVWWNSNVQKWEVQITVNGICKYLGIFIDIEEAAKVYEKAAIKYFGKFARV